MSDLEALVAQLRRLADREAIRDAIHGYAAAMDVRDWSLMREVLAPDITIDLTQDHWEKGRVSLQWHGLDTVLGNLQETAGKHFASHHMITNQRIVIEGDEARAIGYLHSVHLDDPDKPAEHADHGAWYLFRLRRTGDEWQITYLKHSNVWTMPGFKVRGPISDTDVAEMREHLEKR